MSSRSVEDVVQGASRQGVVARPSPHAHRHSVSGTPCRVAHPVVSVAQVERDEARVEDVADRRSREETAARPGAERRGGIAYRETVDELTGGLVERPRGLTTMVLASLFPAV